MSADVAGAPGSALRTLLRTDLRVLVPALLLTGAGLVSLGSTRPDMLGTQLSGVVVGVAAALALVLLPFRTLQSIAWPLWCLSLVLLVLVLVPGLSQEVKGARRWLRLGGLQIQPSELAKAAHVLLLARYVRYRRDHRTFRGLFVPFALTLVPLVLIVKEPDLGSAMLLVPGLFAVLWAAGARTKHLLLVVGFAAAAAPLVYVNLHGYQKQRVDTYLRALGCGPAEGELSAVERARISDADHQADRAELAVAAGGLTGAGWREGRMNLGNKVPEDWTDFIFTVHAEEWGFAGTTVLLCLFALLFFALASLAQECREPAARLLCVGALVTLGCQTCLNLMMTMKLAPVTGVPLPFLSYGRSAMLSAWLLTGLALHARAREPHVFTTTDFD